MSKLISAKQACEILNISISTLYHLTAENKIPHYRPIKKLYFDEDELIAWVKNNQTNGAK